MSLNEEIVPPEAVVALLSASLFVGAGSPKYSNLRTFTVMEKLGDFIISMNYSFTPEDLTEAFGTRPEDAPVLIKRLGGVRNMGLFFPGIGEIEQYLSHPRTDNIVLPLFIPLTIMTTIAISLRMWSRHKVAGAIKSFDWLTLVAYVMTMIWGSVAVYHSHANGPYAFFWDMSWNTLREHYRVNFVLNVLYPWVMLFIKLSLCMFYYRMTDWNYMRWGVWATTFVTVGNTIAGFFVPIFSCSPVNYWDHLIHNPCKSNRRAATIAIGAIYILTDVVIWALPMPMVFQLKLYPRQRLLALITFGVGAIACVASGFRLDSVIKFYTYSSQSSSTVLIDAWTIIEMNIALLCACAPAVRALIIYYTPKILSKVGSTSEGTKEPSSKLAESEKPHLQS